MNGLNPGYFRLLSPWTLGCFLASWLYLLALTHLVTVGIVGGIAIVLFVNLGLFACTSIVQFFVIRRYLFVELRAWIPLAIAGVITAIVALQVIPILIPFSPESQPLARHAHLLIWIMPAIFQWILLRKRFVSHWLWLLAAVVMGPVFAFVYQNNDGIVITLVPDRDVTVLRTAALAHKVADFFLPAIILGLVLYVVINQDRNPVKGKRAAQ